MLVLIMYLLIFLLFVIYCCVCSSGVALVVVSRVNSSIPSRTNGRHFNDDPNVVVPGTKRTASSTYTSASVRGLSVEKDVRI